LEGNFSADHKLSRQGKGRYGPKPFEEGLFGCSLVFHTFLLSTQ